MWMDIKIPKTGIPMKEIRPGLWSVDKDRIHEIQYYDFFEIPDVFKKLPKEVEGKIERLKKISAPIPATSCFSPEEVDDDLGIECEPFDDEVDYPPYP